MSTKSILSIVLVLVVLGVVWKLAVVAFKYALIAAVVYAIYIFFFAGKAQPKE